MTKLALYLVFLLSSISLARASQDIDTSSAQVTIGGFQIGASSITMTYTLLNLTSKPLDRVKLECTLLASDTPLGTKVDIIRNVPANGKAYSESYFLNIQERNGLTGSCRISEISTPD